MIGLKLSFFLLVAVLHQRLSQLHQFLWVWHPSPPYRLLEHKKNKGRPESSCDLDLETSKHAILWPCLDTDKVQNVHHDEKQAENTAHHDHAPRHLMWTLVLLAHSAHFRLRKHPQRDQAGGDAEANDPVEQFLSLPFIRGQCGVFAQKKGAFASSQSARYAANECNGQ